MTAVKRRVYGAAFKAKVRLDPVRGVKTINEIAQKYQASVGFSGSSTF